MINIDFFPYISVDPIDSRWTPRVRYVNIPPPKIPLQLTIQFPHLEKILIKSYAPLNLYWETWPPSMDFIRSGTGHFECWSQKAQKIFEQLWPANGDEWVDKLIDSYGSNWHNALPIIIERDQPDFYKRLNNACMSNEIEISGKYKNYPERTLDEAIKLGPWLRTVKRRKWKFPCPNYCSLCGIGYYMDTVRYYLLRRWGYPSVCPRCLTIASFGIQGSWVNYKYLSLNNTMKYLQKLSSTVQAIPPQSFREKFSNPGFDPKIRDQVIAALICVPNSERIRKINGGVSWLKVLQLAGLVGEAWRPSLGTYCIAQDGHACRSLDERSIDDWMTNHGISHKVEPNWPKDDELNPNGRYRADWKLQDGTFIEYAGLNSEAYKDKIDRKRMIAKKYGIDLVVIFPEDFIRLEEIFSFWIN